ncbi:hypothetical protein HOM50_05355 [bacterium]|nr:hypothetical protein [bacterium]
MREGLKHLVLMGFLFCFGGSALAEQQEIQDKRTLTYKQALEIIEMNQEGNNPYCYITQDVQGMLTLIKKLNTSQTSCVTESMHELNEYCGDGKACVPAQLVFQAVYDVVDLLREKTYVMDVEEANMLRSLWGRLCSHKDTSLYVSDEDLKTVLPVTRAPRTPIGGGRPPAISQEIISGINYVLDTTPSIGGGGGGAIVNNIVKGNLWIDNAPTASIFFENTGVSDPTHYDSRIMAFDGAAANERGTLQVNSTLFVDGDTDRAGVGISNPTAKLDVRGASDAPALHVEATDDVAQTIHLHANAGTSETIDIHSDQGTGLDSVNIHSDVGGVTMTSVATTIGAASSAGELRILEPVADGIHYTGFTAPALVGNVIYTLPLVDGSAGQFLETNGSQVLTWTTPAAGGDVLGPASSTNNEIPRYSLLTGKVIKNSGLILSDIGAGTAATDNSYEAKTATQVIGMGNSVDTGAVNIGVGAAYVGLTTVGSANTTAEAVKIESRDTGGTSAVHITSAGSGSSTINLDTTDATGGIRMSSITITLDSPTAAASQLRISEPSGGGTSYTGFTAPALVANVMYTLPPDSGVATQVLTTDGGASPTLTWATAAGAGDVVGPASSTNNEVPRYNLASGKAIKNSDVLLTDGGATRVDSSFDAKTGGNSVGLANDGSSGTINIGTGAGTGDINIGDFAALAGVRAINVGAASGGANAQTVTVGSGDVASVTTLQSGTGKLTITNASVGGVSPDEALLIENTGVVTGSNDGIHIHSTAATSSQAIHIDADVGGVLIDSADTVSTAVNVTTGTAAGFTSGGIQVLSGTPAAGTAIVGSGIVVVKSGDGAARTDVATAGNAGNVTVETGAGGATSAAAGGTGGDGGDLALTGGDGGADTEAASGTAGNGGNVTITAGSSGATTGGTSGDGGTITLTGGSADATTGTDGAAGGVIVNAGGIGGTSGSLGNAVGLRINGSGQPSAAAPYNNVPLYISNGTLASDGNTYSIEAEQDIVAPNFRSTSDGRLKMNVETMDCEACLNKIAALRPITFDFIPKRLRNASGKKDTGFIAQEVRRYIPELVGEDDPTGHPCLNINYSKLVVELTGAVQALLQRIEFLEKDGLVRQREILALEKEAINRQKELLAIKNITHAAYRVANIAIEVE